MIEGVELIAVFFGADPGALDRLAHYREARKTDGVGAKMIAAASAFAWAASGGPAAEVEALALEAISGGELLASGNGLSWSAVTVALMLCESSRAPEWNRMQREEAYRRGSRFSVSSCELFEGAHMLIATGDLQEGVEAVRISLRLQELWGSDATGDSWARALAGLGELLIGDPVQARAALGAAPPDDEESDGANLWRRTQAELLLADGRAGEALEQAELMGRSARHVKHPDWKPWQSLKARALAQLGQPDEAIAAMEAELELARAVGGRRVVGRCLRQLAELEGDAGEGRLHDAIERLSGTPARLELARALAALGGLLRRTRRPTEAREPLRQALELAEACGAATLVESVRSELYATGARPRTAALAGVDSLTARELRVATLARDGQTDPIAQTLFVTPRTVEVHLSSAYRKLDIRSRRDLAGALG